MRDRIRLCLDHMKLAGISEETSFQRKENERCVWNKGMFPTVPEERQRYRRKTQELENPLEEYVSCWLFLRSFSSLPLLSSRF
jgi:hypothetical protein